MIFSDGISVGFLFKYAVEDDCEVVAVVDRTEGVPVDSSEGLARLPRFK